MCWPGKFNPFYIGPYPERACGDCPYGIYSGFTRCGWNGGNGPFGTTFCDPSSGGDCSRCGPCCDSYWGSFCCPSSSPCCNSWCSPSRGSRGRSGCCVMCCSGLGHCCGEPCRKSCCSYC